MKNFFVFVFLPILLTDLILAVILPVERTIRLGIAVAIGTMAGSYLRDKYAPEKPSREEDQHIEKTET